MIARGDLAVELSFEKLAEIQEEILWFGEACHLPVVWATQVLDSATHTGLATRAEVTDAAMAMRAECVMLNKGPHIGTAVRMLADIIRKMEAHQYKKRSLYRPLSVARDAPEAGSLLEPRPEPGGAEGEERRSRAPAAPACAATGSRSRFLEENAAGDDEEMPERIEEERYWTTVGMLAIGRDSPRSAWRA
jgi:hypothetical protein